MIVNLACISGAVFHRHRTCRHTDCLHCVAILTWRSICAAGVIVTGHYPLYETYDTTSAHNLALAQAEPDRGARGVPGMMSASAPVQPSKAQALLDFEPLLAEFAVVSRALRAVPRLNW